MDHSLDSIGSCSLDVDADSLDISDTSGSLNFPTPLSVRDITHEFTANTRERCTLRSPVQPQHTTAYFHPIKNQVRMVLTSPTNAEHSATDITTPVDESAIRRADAVVYDKKPSYLNLACCVNGYSNLTTYDSKIRQDINKSREVSPIRPSASSLQYCKKNNSLAAPVLLKMSNETMPLTKQPSPGNKYTLIETNNNNNNKNGHHENGNVQTQCNGTANGSTISFIQQRVERLYGPGALAQGFYSPKKHRNSPVSPHAASQQLQVESSQSSELVRKFKQLSPSRDYSQFQKKLDSNCAQSATVKQMDNMVVESVVNGKSGDVVDLPVFRHLSHEFRAQLPTVSPKRNIPRTSPAPEVLLPLAANDVVQLEETASVNKDVVDHEPMQTPQLRTEELLMETKIKTLEPTQLEESQKDGNHFLKILKSEQARLLALAAVAEKYTDALSNNPDISEETLGLLRSASGKARLLVSQKMKQFEGLCHNNLNRSPEDEFPTTFDDLQGFWDMVYLQVAHIDSTFLDIEQLKSNDWKRTVVPPKAENLPKTTRPTKSGTFKSKSATTTAASAVASVNNSKSGGGGNTAAALKREAQRKQLLEMKRQRREAMAAAKNTHALDGNGAELTNAIGAIGDINNVSIQNSS